jgi:hypothetical protein
MPRYFFNIVVRDRKPIEDPDGDLFPDAGAARRHAAIVAREMLADSHWYDRNIKYWAFAITDKQGRAIGRVAFSSPASKKAGVKRKSRR